MQCQEFFKTRSGGQISYFLCLCNIKVEPFESEKILGAGSIGTFWGFAELGFTLHFKHKCINALKNASRLRNIAKKKRTTGTGYLLQK